MLQPIDFWLFVRGTAIWWSPITAGFIGAFGVHLLTQSRERERWIVDSKKQEYRELLSTISQAHASTRSAPSGFANKEDHEQYSAISPIQDTSERAFGDRIFITNYLPLHDLQQSWRKAMDEYSFAGPWSIGIATTPASVFDREYSRIKNQIVAAAIRSVPKTPWQRLAFWNN